MISKSDVHEFFQEWSNALKTGQTEQVLELYAPDAILLPTLSDRLRSNHKEIAEYFDKFLKLCPVARIKEEYIRIFDDIAINSGIYVFNVVQGGVASEFPVRFSFVYKDCGKQWKIVEHHSSVLPKRLN